MTRWLSETEFGVALDRGRRAAREEAERRLALLVTRAVTVIERAIDSGDARVAVAVLRGVGLLRGSGPAERPAAPEEGARLDHLSVSQLEALQQILQAADAQAVDVTALPPTLGDGSRSATAGAGPAEA